MDIFDISKSLSEKFDSTVELAEGLKYSLKDTNRQIEFITNSKYLSGDLDEFGREKPYYNIANFRLNVGIRATDFDTKDIQVVSDTRDYVRSMLISKEIDRWMKQVNFAKTLNRMVEKRPKYGWLLVKRVMTDGKLDIQIVDARNAVVNQTGIMRSPIIEKHTLTRAELASKADVWDNVQGLLDLGLEEYAIQEITGEMPDSVAGGSEDTYSLYKYIIFEDGEDNSFELFSETLKDNPYKTVSWAAMDGRLGRGLIEDMFEAQTGTNEVKLLERDAVILASKTGFVTNDDTLENNIITDLDNGFILKLDENKTFTQVNTMTNALPAFDRLKADWDEQAEKVTSTFEALTGETLPSGTPFRSVAIQNQEASSLFSYRREEMGIFLTELFNDWIIPELIKNINQEHILASEFNAEELSKIDERFSKYEANKRIKDILLNQPLSESEDITAEKYQEMQDSFVELIQETENKRFVKVPKDYFKDFEFKISVITTNEQRNKSAVLESISKIIGDITSTFNPQTGTFAMLENPALASIFAQAVELSGSGISPVSLNQLRSSGKNAKAPTTGTQTQSDEPIVDTASNVDQNVS